MRNACGAMVVLLGILCGGCAVEDGGACGDDDDCSSNFCHEGYCGGSECSDTEHHSDCEQGWECTYLPPSLIDDIGASIGGLFGGDGEAEGDEYCQPTCGHCPPNYHCGQRTEGLCDYGAPTPEVTLNLPGEVIRGQAASLSASLFIEQGTAIRYVWTLTREIDGSVESAETMHPELQHSFATQGSHRVELVVHADNATSGSDVVTLYVVGVAGDECSASSHCSSALRCDDGVCR